MVRLAKGLVSVLIGGLAFVSPALAYQPGPYDTNSDNRYEVFFIDVDEARATNLNHVVVDTASPDVAVPDRCVGGCTLRLQDISQLLFDHFTSAVPAADQLAGIKNQYDQLVVLPTFPLNAGTTAPDFITINNTDIQNIGLSSIDQSGVYGGGRGIMVFPDIIDEGTVTFSLPTVPELARWAGHYYGPAVRADQNVKNSSNQLFFKTVTGPQDSFWSSFLHNPAVDDPTKASYWGGAVWTCSGGSCTTGGPVERAGYSELDLYLMGLMAPEAMSPFGYAQLATFPAEQRDFDITAAGSFLPLTIDNVIGGPNPTPGLERVPEFSEAQKVFNQAYIVLTSGTTGAPGFRQAIGTEVAALADAYALDFVTKTEARGEVQTRVQQNVDVLFLLDLSGSFGDDIATFKAGARELMERISYNPCPGGVCGIGQRDDGAGWGARFALASFSDFPFLPYGDFGTSDYAYRVDYGFNTLIGRPTSGLGKQTAINDIMTTVDGLTTYWAADEPQCQYEALWQVLRSYQDEVDALSAPFQNGTGLDLNNDGDYTDPGEIQQTRLNADPNVPLLVYLFTDAPFHDPGIDPVDSPLSYPLPEGFDYGGEIVCPGTASDGSCTCNLCAADIADRAHDKSEVFSLLSNTPFVMGMAVGLDPDDEESVAKFAELQEVVTASGGEMHPLEDGSEGFGEVITSKISTPELNRDVAVRAEAIPDLAVNNKSVMVGWFGSDDLSLTGTINLPDGLSWWDLEGDAELAVLIDNVQVVDHATELYQWGPFWTRYESGVSVSITFLTPNKAVYSVAARFDGAAAGVDGGSTPTVYVQLGLGEGAELVGSDQVSPDEFLFAGNLTWVSI